MNIHVLTPLYRIHLIPTLIYYLKPMNINWKPIVFPEENVFSKYSESWIHPVLMSTATPQTNFVPYEKINTFITQQDIIDDDYYTFMGDDDMVEPGFFDVIRQQKAGVLFYSNYRGDTIPYNAVHHTDPIIIKTINDIRVCNIGLGMCTLKGSILRKTLFKLQHEWDDGIYMEMLVQKFKKSIHIIPDLFVFGNYFEQGRHTKTEAFLKPTWELPKFM
jgi:hypothetical protein